MTSSPMLENRAIRGRAHPWLCVQKEGKVRSHFCAPSSMRRARPPHSTTHEPPQMRTNLHRRTSPRMRPNRHTAQCDIHRHHCLDSGITHHFVSQIGMPPRAPHEATAAHFDHRRERTGAPELVPHVGVHFQAIVLLILSKSVRLRDLLRASVQGLRRAQTGREGLDANSMTHTGWGGSGPARNMLLVSCSRRLAPWQAENGVSCKSVCFPLPPMEICHDGLIVARTGD